MNRVALGLGLLAVIIGGIVAATVLDLDVLRRATGPEDVTLSIVYGGEKRAFLENPAVIEALDRAGLTLDARSAGSIEMATTLDVTGVDCLWPSNAVAVELAREAGRPVLSADPIFESPIVIYAWSEAAEGLAARGLLGGEPERRTIALADLTATIEAGTRWSDLGLPYYGRVRVTSTDPARSNSGNIWAALLATGLNGGETPTAADLPPILPAIEAYFEALGLMQSSSGTLFASFLTGGPGSLPLISGYENQLVETIRESPDLADLIDRSITVIYPEPTILASHPLISLTAGCRRLAAELQSDEVQAIAWRDHGFRTGLASLANDPAELARLPATIPSVAPMPRADAMEAIIAAVAD